MVATIGDIGEFGFITRLRRRLPHGTGVPLGIGDDAAVVATPDQRVVVSTDVLVERNHFRTDWSSGYEIGRKAAAQNLSDIAAMGARATALLVGLGLPLTVELSWTDQLAAGLADEAGLVGASLVGGDTVRGDHITLAVTVLGDLEGREPVRRSGARGGDLVAVAGRLGWSAAGLALLTADRERPRVLIAAHRRPRPPYDAGPEAARLGATAMIDISDGLLADAGHIASESGVWIDLLGEALPVSPVLARAAVRLGGLDPREWVLSGGEDHALLATFPPDVRLPERWRVIGVVRNGSGVTVDGAPSHTAGGWDHFG